MSGLVFAKTTENSVNSFQELADGLIVVRKWNHSFPARQTLFLLIPLAVNLSTGAHSRTLLAVKDRGIVSEELSKGD